MVERMTRETNPYFGRFSRFGIAVCAAGIAITGCNASENKTAAATAVSETTVQPPNSSILSTSSEAPVSTPLLVLRPDDCDPDSPDPVVRGDEVLYCEEVQAHEIKSFTEFENASGIIGIYRAGSYVLVSCLIEHPNSEVSSAARNPDKPGVAEWYALKDGGYAASNTFVNDPGDKIPTADEPTVDPRVPLC